MTRYNIIFFSACLIGVVISPLKAQKSSQDEMTRLKALSAVADKMPAGAERDALVAIIQKSLEELDVIVTQDAKELAKLSYLDIVGVEQSQDWALAELKKSELGKLVPDVITLKDGRSVKKEVVTMLNPTGLRWIGDRIEETNWTNLPDKLAADYGWNKSRQAAFEQWKTTATMNANANAAAARLRSMQEQNDSVARASKMSALTAGRVAVSFRVSQALKAGCLSYGARIETSAYWGGWEGLRWVDGLQVAEEHDEPIFIVGLPSSVVDGDKLAGWLYPCGIYRYTTVAGSEKSVRRYATTAQKASELTN